MPHKIVSIRVYFIMIFIKFYYDHADIQDNNNKDKNNFEK